MLTVGRPRLDVPANAMIRWYERGMGTYNLARFYGVSRMTVWRTLRRAGVEMRPRGASLGQKNTRKFGGPLHTDKKGYLRTYSREGKPSCIHRACWEAYHGLIPEGQLIHHIDEDRQNNAIENLAPMTQAEHNRLHHCAFRVIVLKEE